MRYVIDTNILVYCFDESETSKQSRALRIVEQVGRAESGALPAQVLAEFANVALYRLEPTLAATEVYEQVDRYKQVFTVFPLTPAVVLETVRGVQDHSFSYVDAQIWAVAKLAQCPIILSEDFATGATVEGVSFLNPLDPDIDLSALR
ncbi:PIN domain nuclease [Longimonas halophila]|uniref:PIN domain nuclease n=1 Tax=Longimonas halophila TaxID=1469170 RepID=A0A2H3NPY3_9BACT|nr:PIN domain-containing protein [Longimonas halophila]PEN05078.1 PIN domain nuclease [Longimonas halophila]